MNDVFMQVIEIRNKLGKALLENFLLIIIYKYSRRALIYTRDWERYCKLSNLADQEVRRNFPNRIPKCSNSGRLLLYTGIFSFLPLGPVLSHLILGT